MGENAERWSQYLKNYLAFWQEVKNIESSESPPPMALNEMSGRVDYEKVISTFY